MDRRRCRVEPQLVSVSYGKGELRLMPYLLWIPLLGYGLVLGVRQSSLNIAFHNRGGEKQ